MKQIYAMDTIPTKIDDWYTCAIHFKTQWERADAIAHKKPYNPYPTQKNHTPIHQSSNPKVDPYAMDVNSIHIEKLTQEEREKYIREGQCLWCRKPGHYPRNCSAFPNNTPCPNTKQFQKKIQPEPKRIVKIKEVLEVQEGEEVSHEEELSPGTENSWIHQKCNKYR